MNMVKRQEPQLDSHLIAPHASAPKAYCSKAPDYRWRRSWYDYVAELPLNPHAKILEIGCSNGGTGALALSREKCAVYIGIELFEDAAVQARERISEVLVGDIEKSSSYL